MPTNSPATLREAYVQASSFLRQSGVLEPESNARLLLEHVLGESRSGLLLRWGEPFPASRRAVWETLLARKADGEPVQYIIGEQEFYGLPFTVTPDVLIPRPETELLVEQVARLGAGLWPEERNATGPTVADIGTGSGAIAVSLAVQRPSWRLTASDLSAAALGVARINAARHGVADRIAWVEGDLLEPWLRNGQRLDAVVSNPPYIPLTEEASLQKEVRLFEPHLALFGGSDGLAPYRRMAEQIGRLPAPPQLVGVEVGQGQAPEVGRLLGQAAAWDELVFIRDLAGIERHVIAYRHKK